MRPHVMVCLLALLLAALLPFVVQGYGNRLANTALISAIAVIGLNFVFGYAGLISLAHAAFVGMAAYAVAILTTVHGWNPWLAALAAIAVTCVSAWVTGRILLRLKGHYLALATLGLNVSFTIVASNWLDLTGGTNGISGIAALRLGGWTLDDEPSFYWFALAVLTLLALLAARVRDSHAGRTLLAVRDDELAERLRAHVAQGRAAIERDGIAVAEIQVFHQAQMQFEGQSHLLTVALPSDQPTVAQLRQAFAQAYWQRFEVELSELHPVLVTLDTSLVGKRQAIALDMLRGPSAPPAAPRTRPVWFAEAGWVDTPIVAREHVPAAGLTGPAIVEQLDATIVIDPGACARSDAHGNLIISL